MTSQTSDKKFKPRPTCIAAAAAVTAVLAGFSSAANAQAAAQSAGERIEVTGSIIKRVNIEGRRAAGTRPH
jgi:hypothetical protein